MSAQRRASELPIPNPYDGEQVATSGKLRLVRMNQFHLIPDGTKMVSMFGKRRVIGVDGYHGDSRGGLASWGFIDGDDVPEGIELSDEASIEIQPLDY